MADALERLKVLIDSSTPTVVMETSEETRAVRMVRIVCSALNLATFEWSIASSVGIEPGCAHSVSKDKVTFPRAPLQSRKVGFPDSGFDLGYPREAFPRR
jgi:hypothetical protein